MPMHLPLPLSLAVDSTAEPAVLMSVVKPMVMLAVFAGWGRVVTFFDKDAQYYFLKRRLFNGIQIGVAALALLLWLVIPLFFVGMLVALLLLGGGLFAYVYYHNAALPAKAHWTFSLESFRQQLDERQHQKLQKFAALKLLKKDGSAIEVPTGEDPQAAAHQALEHWIDFMLPRGGDRIDIRVDAEQATVQVHVDGVKYPQPAVDSRLAVTVIDYLKGKAGLDLADRRKRQSGSQLVEFGEYGRHTLGLSTAGSTRELMLSITLDPDKSTALKLDKLGLLPSQRQALAAVLEEEPTRVVLVAAPPHQGLTTTLYNLLQQHDPYTQSIMTYEDAVAWEIEGVTHETVEPGTDAAGQAKRLASIFRHGPNVVMVSRVTEPAVAKVLAEAATDVRVYAGLVQPDAITALKAWAKAVGDVKAAAATLRAIVVPRLVRKLCMTCRIAYQPDPEGLRKLNLPADKAMTLFKQSGQVMIKNKPEPCPECMGIGYKGRTAVFEVMVFDDTARELLAAGQLDQVRAHVRKQKMLWLQEAALSKVIEGVTSISEITRALGGGK